MNFLALAYMLFLALLMLYMRGLKSKQRDLEREVKLVREILREEDSEQKRKDRAHN
ncbi:hypothetical protein [Halarsenatibacter silvermanii]|uniref:CcmD family protein n=1 Tax=Halarsenatibacter silvermanii TaxID=321763 RepID=A0A1G9SIA4_9FIRM|nr:hypothetical protein [Halarsenatibacter silvermanii]SDM35141.1 hypothetical protein SAMN04488692_1297 [Halarsenatibacter silvermanii]